MEANEKTIYHHIECECPEMQVTVVIQTEIAMQLDVAMHKNLRRCTTISCRIGIEMRVLNMGCFRNGGRIIGRIDKSKV
jgi:hypothetical protein